MLWLKEFLRLVAAHDFNGIFRGETHSGFVQFFRYIFVGGVATVADWGILFILDRLFPELLYLSVALAFCAGLAVNYLFSVKFVFHSHLSGGGRLGEIAVYIITGLIGLGLTELIMHFAASVFLFDIMISKIVATALVFAWNFGSKKIILYRKNFKK